MKPDQCLFYMFLLALVVEKYNRCFILPKELTKETRQLLNSYINALPGNRTDDQSLLCVCP